MEPTHPCRLQLKCNVLPLHLCQCWYFCLLCTLEALNCFLDHIAFSSRVFFSCIVLHASHRWRCLTQLLLCSPCRNHHRLNRNLPAQVFFVAILYWLPESFEKGRKVVEFHFRLLTWYSVLITFAKCHNMNMLKWNIKLCVISICSIFISFLPKIHGILQSKSKPQYFSLIVDLSDTLFISTLIHTNTCHIWWTLLSKTKNYKLKNLFELRVLLLPASLFRNLIKNWQVPQVNSRYF